MKCSKQSPHSSEVLAPSDMAAVITGANFKPCAKHHLLHHYVFHNVTFTTELFCTNVTQTLANGRDQCILDNSAQNCCSPVLRRPLNGMHHCHVARQGNLLVAVMVVHAVFQLRGCSHFLNDCFYVYCSTIHTLLCFPSYSSELLSCVAPDPLTSVVHPRGGTVCVLACVAAWRAQCPWQAICGHRKCHQDPCTEERISSYRPGESPPCSPSHGSVEAHWTSKRQELEAREWFLLCHTPVVHMDCN